jgi:Meckel syndrome type 1 protein
LQPEVLAWALLFVVAFGIVYRFFAWVGHRLREPPPAQTVSRVSDAVAVENPSPPVVPIAAAAPAVATVPLAQPPQASVELAPTPTVEAALENVIELSPPAPELRAEITRNPLASSAVMSARIAAAAVRTALAPSVAATLPPLPKPKPSIVATLPPAAPNPPPAAAALTAAAETPPSETSSREGSEPETVEPPTPEVVTMPEAVVPAPPLTDLAAPSEPATPDDAPVHQESRAPIAVRLRDRWISGEAISLDIRLREASDRKIRQTPKTTRKPAEPAAAKELRVLVPKSVPEKAPARRIGRKAGDAIAFASTKARTKILGATHGVSRVLSAPAS